MRLFPKLTLAISALVLGTVGSLSLYFFFYQRNRIIENAYNDERRVLLNLVHIAQESFLIKDDLLLVRFTSSLTKWNPALVSASVVTPTGDVLAHTRPEEIGHAQKQTPQESSIYLLSEPIHLGPQWLATASVAFSKTQIERQIHDDVQKLRKRVLEVAGLFWLLGVSVALLLALSWTRRIKHLAACADRIGRGEWAIDTESMQTRKDEIGFLARSFQKMAGQLKELDHMKEDFVSAVTHELRSPLGAIESYLNLIDHETKKGLGSEGWKLYGERLRVNTQRLNKFVNDLLDVAALERGKVLLHRAPISIGVLLKEVGEFYQLKSKEKEITLDWVIAPDLPSVSLDSDKIRQVIVNLLSNALKFTPNGGHVSLEAEQRGPVLRVSVRDSGPGVSLENQKRIFNKFEQIQTSRQSVKGPKGTGLGLSICKALVELHGGVLGVESEPQKGSVFYFELPVQSPEPAEVMA